MKKLITLLLILALLLPAAGLTEGYPELPDLSVYDQVDLVEIASQINAILFPFALNEGVMIPAGEYIVDVDIPSGTYRADAVSNVGGVCMVYDQSGKLLSEVYLGDMYGTYTFRLVLENQNIVLIKYNSLKLYPYKGILDFSEEKP